LNKFIKDCFTTHNGETWDVGRILWAMSVLTFLGCAIFAIAMGQTWDAVSFGTGAGLVLAGGGAALGFKVNTEAK
jgi:hypothetical protein